MSQIEIVPDGSVTSPRGFTAGGVYAGIKKPGENVLDLGMIYSRQPCQAAAVFTTNKIKSAAVVVNQEHLQKHNRVSAVIVNSGCANSSTGRQGIKDAHATTEMVAYSLGIDADEVMVGSTGVIGVNLPMAAIKQGIEKMILTADGGHTFERAIMTTDTTPKEIAVKVEYEGGSFTIGGCAKGSGMIHPNMATMLCFITTDAVVNGDYLNQALKDAVNLSFNMISVDGDTSPSDTVLLMANGVAKNKIIDADSPAANIFQRGLNQVCLHLAQAIARDGEGATKLIEVTVKGARSLAEARRAARTIVSSSLVKSAVYGCDPNWGRVTAALGRSDVEVIEARLDVVMAGILTLKDGAPVDFNKQAATDALKTKEVKIEVDLHLGPAEATAWGCDLTEQYVVINSQYTT